MTPRAKVVQTVVCSTFTHGAKPATRKVADGERVNPQGKSGAFAPIPGDDEHQGDEPEDHRASDHKDHRHETGGLYRLDVPR